MITKKNQPFLRFALAYECVNSFIYLIPTFLDFPVILPYLRFTYNLELFLLMIEWVCTEHDKHELEPKVLINLGESFTKSIFSVSLGPTFLRFRVVKVYRTREEVESAITFFYLL